MNDPPPKLSLPFGKGSVVPTPELRAKQIRKRASPKRLGGEVLGRESEPEDPQAGVRSSVARVLGGFGGPSPRGGGPSELIRWGQVRTGGADRPGAVSRFLGAHVPPDLPPGGHGGGQRDPMLLPAPEGQARRQPPGHRGIGEVPPPVGDARGPNPTQRRVNARGTSGIVWGGWAWGQPSPSIPSPAHGPWPDGKARAKAPRATRR